MDNKVAVAAVGGLVAGVAIGAAVTSAMRTKSLGGGSPTEALERMLNDRFDRQQAKEYAGGAPDSPEVTFAGKGANYGSVDDIPALAGGLEGIKLEAAFQAQERQRVVVKVPATSANMGPGYDTIGVALDVWNTLTVEKLAEGQEMQIEVTGEGAGILPLTQDNLVVTGAKKAFTVAKKPFPPLYFKLENRIPFARGMGSSSAAIVSGLVAGLVLAGHECQVWGAEEVLQMACEIEGHPDNVAPCLYGGMQLGLHTGVPNEYGRWLSSRVSLPGSLIFVLFIPDKVTKTSEARGVLPDKYSVEDCVFNVGRVAFLVNSLSTGNLKDLVFSTQDKMHQPYRAKNEPHLMPMMEAATQAGAMGCFLSGAGPSVMAMTAGVAGDAFVQRNTERREKIIAEAMQKAAEKVGVKGRLFITSPVERGCRVTDATPSFSDGVTRYT